METLILDRLASSLHVVETQMRLKAVDGVFFVAVSGTETEMEKETGGVDEVVGEKERHVRVVYGLVRGVDEGQVKEILCGGACLERRDAKLENCDDDVVEMET